MVKPRMLIVDDEPLMARICVRILREYFEEIHYAENPDQALTLMRMTRYDCVLSDDAMPKDGQGREFLKTVAELYPETNRYLMSGTYKLNLKDLEGIVDGFLAKPFQSNELLNLITEKLN